MINGMNYPLGSEIRIIDKYPIREFSALSCDSGITLCAKDRGAFLVLRYKEDLEALKDLINKIEITSSFSDVNDEVR